MSSNEDHDDAYLTLLGCVGFCFCLQEDGEYSMARRGAAITCEAMCQEHVSGFQGVQFHIRLSSWWNGTFRVGGAEPFELVELKLLLCFGSIAAGRGVRRQDLPGLAHIRAGGERGVEGA